MSSSPPRLISLQAGAAARHQRGMAAQQRRKQRQPGGAYGTSVSRIDSSFPVSL